MEDELAQVPEEFRAACGRPGSGGATVSATPSVTYAGGYNSGGFSLTVHSGTLDVSVDVKLPPGEPRL